MRQRSTVRLTYTGVAALAVLVCAGAAWAQNGPSVQGTITEKESGALLPGAEVSLRDTPHRTLSGSDGRYRLDGVPAGDYTLDVNYVGFEDFEAGVTVAAGETVSLAIELDARYEFAEEIVVQAVRFGQSKALNEQKQAINIKTVLSEEQIQSFPDLNTAEVLQRVSGVAIQRDNGEGRFVSMRGTPSAMTNITINGQQVAYSNSANRMVELDVISAAQLTGIEVTKVLTPDMDADSVGGAVNLKTRSAFDQPDGVTNFTLGFGDNSIADGTHSRSAFNYSTVGGANDNLGFSIGVNFARTAAERHNNEHKWGSEDTVGGVEIPYALTNTEAQFSANDRDRYGANARLEVRINDNHKLDFAVVQNYREDDQDRQITRIRWDKGKYLSPTEVEGLRLVKSLHDRLEEQEITAYSVSGEHRLGLSVLDFSLSTSSAFTKKPEGQLKPEFQARGFDLNVTDIGSKAPGWDSTRQDIHNSGIFEFDAVDEKFENTTSTIDTAKVDLTRPMQWGSDTGEFKLGVKVRALQKDRADLRSKWKWKGDNLFLDQFEAGGTNMTEGGYNLGQQYNRSGFRSFFYGNQGPNGFVEEVRNDVNLGEPYNAEEDINSVYAMTTQEYGKLTMLLGVRAEFNDLDYSAANLVVNDDDVLRNTQESVSRSYDFVYPNLQFRYAVSDETLVRAAFTRSMARPNFWDSMPFSYTHTDDEEIIRGNPYLDPALANNVDFLVERFLDNVGIISGGVFFKSVDDFNFVTATTQRGGEFDGFDVEEPVNGGNADLMGIEVAWQQHWDSGFGIYANYTYTDVMSIDLGEQTDRDDINVLPEQRENVGNLALIYEKNRILTRLALNMSDRWLSEVGDEAGTDEWADSAMYLDYSFTYLFENGLELFLQANNLTEEIVYLYRGIASRASQQDITGRTFNAGMRWSF
ncbi:MAG: TonB-dependent receptor [Holophagales bacterium]|nr:TonB-dependent receptor [Holophagales bacterium]MYG30851.1 TonB-dependent receptor [Holophagales bacterium]MYI80410.1 TonB-dependent receptor [Holophagales bacterium]